MEKALDLSSDRLLMMMMMMMMFQELSGIRNATSFTLAEKETQRKSFAAFRVFSLYIRQSICQTPSASRKYKNSIN